MVRTALIATAAAAGFAAQANADFVDVRYLGTGRGQELRVEFNGHTQNLFAGQLRHRLSNGTGDAAALNGDHLTFCSDLAQYVSSSTKTYETVAVALIPASSPMGALKAAAIYDLYTAGSALALESDADNKRAAAFQIALWEIVSDYDGSAASLSLTAGSFKAFKKDGGALDATIRNHALALFAAVGSNTEHSVHLTGLSSRTAQDQILAGFNVPAPASGALALAGCLVLARRRRA
ncbi:MAG: hypothetical protein HRU70_06725 [Phycisphaeraceae bacterium]|nr:MAG: hypothetical protein HRU70_06725 [Phycisphaeraceae bacterium]